MPVSPPTPPPGRTVTRYFTHAGVHPYDEIAWERRDASIGGGGKTVFEQKDVEVPAFWDQLAVNIVVSKYFRGHLGEPERETSVRQMIDRVAGTITGWGRDNHYFADAKSEAAFEAELTWLLLNQRMAFNSPVWFNAGWRENPQMSACLPYDERVNTDLGLIPIGEIVRRLNDPSQPTTKIHAYDPSGKLTRITGAICNGKRRLRLLHLGDGSELRVTSDHHVFVEGPEGPIEKRADELVPGLDHLIMSRQVLRPDTRIVAQGIGQVTPEIAWLAGLMVGDGFSGQPKSATSPTWEIKLNTPAELARLEAVLKGVGLTFAVYPRSWGFIVRGHGAAARGFWTGLDLWQKTKAKRVPEWVFRAGLDLVGPFLRGLFDADGTVSLPTNGRVSVDFSNSSEPVARAAQSLLRSLGVFASLRRYDDSRRDYVRQPSFTVGIQDQASVDLFAERIGFSHENKAARLAARRPADDVSYRRDSVLVENISIAGAELVYDIQTESATFWADGRLLHNCFINEVEDSMESIMDLARTEALLFKGGSGAGVNLSRLRADGERLSGGGTATGPLSFMKGWDAFAGSIKSGGSTRRAAKMIIIDADHPDVEAFVESKVHEEEKALALIREGYDGSFTGEAYASIFYQNANHSVRVTDEFMRAVESNGDWELRGRVDHRLDRKIRASSLFEQIAAAAWRCGDPGIQFDTTFNTWHTLSNTDRIYATNPCSEYSSLNNTSCNLASLNLLAFLKPDGKFDIKAYKRAIDLTILAQEIIVGSAGYPTPKITEMTKAVRALGLGYANLGALLMSMGLPYDSAAGQYVAGALTALMGGEAYAESARIARDCGGPFSLYADNRAPMLRVIDRHLHALEDLNAGAEYIEPDLLHAARRAWADARELGQSHGYRNSQVTVLAPTGTISFLLGCTTTGIEPAISLVSYKTLVGGGSLKMVNTAVPAGLRALGYDEAAIERMVAYIDAQETIEGSPDLAAEHLPVFDCAFKAANGSRTIAPAGHIKMMAAAQPFLSGAISKTVNLPESATVEDIEQVYLQGWRLGLKAIAVYRDNCKASQPLNTSRAAENDDEDQALSGEGALEKLAELESALAAAQAQISASEARLAASEAAKNASTRRRLPATRRSLTHRFSVSGSDGYITVGLYEDGQPGEIFLTMAKAGSTVSGFADAWATAVSIALQHSAPLASVLGKFVHTRFEPAGFTGSEAHPIAQSVVDYVATWLAIEFLTPEERIAMGVSGKARGSGLTEPRAGTREVSPAPARPIITQSASDKSLPELANVPPPELPTSPERYEPGRICTMCGSTQLQRSGTCLVCAECGTTTGCG